MLAVSGASAAWYLTRGTGIVSLLLLTASVLLGVTSSVRWAAPRWPRFITAALHRNVSLLVVVFLGVHIATSVLDGFAPIGWLDAVVPLRAGYRPVWLGLGAVAFDLLIAITVTSLVRVRLGFRTWRIVHWTSYLCWPVALLHGLGTGSDTKLTWVLVLSLASLFVVVLAVWWRLSVGWPEHAVARIAGAVAAIVVPMVMVAWVMLGPLRPGWARRAGTPASLLGARPASADVAAPTGAGGAGSATGAATGALTPPFTASFTGTARSSAHADGNDGTITIDGTLSGGATGVVQVVLHGPATDSGGVVLSSGTVTLGPPAQPRLYSGTVTRLVGRRISATVEDVAGHRIAVDLRVEIDQASGATTGMVQAA